MERDSCTVHMEITSTKTSRRNVTPERARRHRLFDVSHRGHRRSRRFLSSRQSLRREIHASSGQSLASIGRVADDWRSRHRRNVDVSIKLTRFRITLSRKMSLSECYPHLPSRARDVRDERRDTYL